MFKIVTSTEALPVPVRRKSRLIAATKEWREMAGKITSGLKPHEAAVVSFSPDQLKTFNVRTLPKIFAKLTKDLITELEVPYDMVRYESDDKSQVIVVSHRALSKSELSSMGRKLKPVVRDGRRRKVA